MSHRKLLIPLILIVTACHVNKAPADLNAIQIWFWDNYDVATDAEIADAVNKLDALKNVHSISDTANFSGSLPTNLKSSDLANVKLTANNPATAPGLLIVDQMNCTVDQIEPLLYDKKQDVIHTGDYVHYQRTYTSSLDDYNARKANTLTWQSDITVSEIGAGYTDTVFGGLRRIPDLGKSVTPFGPIVLSRTWLPKPATNLTGANGGKSTFNQDYEIEVYYERTTGHTIHDFGDWRDLSLSTSLGVFTGSNTTYQSILLNNDLTWDQQIVSDCGKPSSMFN